MDADFRGLRVRPSPEDADSPKTGNCPTANDDPGKPGEFAWDSGYLYICVAENTWKRATISWES